MHHVLCRIFSAFSIYVEDCTRCISNAVVALCHPDMNVFQDPGGININQELAQNFILSDVSFCGTLLS
jgi:hypothetical protein